MIVGVSGNWRDDPGEHKLNDAYVRCIADNGGTPMVLPVTDNPEVIRAYLDHIDALLLTGGGDMHPKYWGAELSPLSHEPSEFRDRFDIELTSEAVRRNIRTLGICRGMQALAIVTGGTLYEDIAAQAERNAPIIHSQSEPRSVPTHGVHIDDNSLLSRITGETDIRVNSFHHQAVWRTSADCRVVARADDGIIEAVELTGRPIVGVQWHPEELYRESRAARHLFRWLISGEA